MNYAAPDYIKKLADHMEAELSKPDAGKAERMACLGLLSLRRLGEFDRIKRICKGELALVAEIEEAK